MKPEKIYLVRHAQSLGNSDKSTYLRMPDYSIPLTPKGIQQAREAGIKLREKIGDAAAFCYVSSFRRTKETFLEMRKAFNPNQLTYREDPRIIEQEWLGRMQGYDGEQEAARKIYGHFYYRFQGGESCADVYSRVSSFLDTLHRDFEKPDFPKYCVIVSHGMLLRVLLMRWFHLTVEDFELLKNPWNASIIEMNLIPKTNKYELDKPFPREEKPEHNWGYPIE